MSGRPTSKRNRPKPKAVLRLPDLDQAKSAVLNSLSSADAQRGYRHAIDEFVEWYCSEPRLSFSKTVVVRYRMHLETPPSRARHNQPLPRGRPTAGIRGVRMRPPERRLGCRIRRVKGVKKLGVRSVSSAGRAWGEAVTEKLVWHVVKEFDAKIGVTKLAPHDLRRSCPRSAAAPAANWSRFNSFLATSRSRPQNATSVAPSGFHRR